MQLPVLLLFRNDLRLDDHAALEAALGAGPVVPAYVASEEDEGAWPLGEASRWWLDRSLRDLDRRLRERGSRLSVERGAVVEAVVRWCREVDACQVFCSRRYEPGSDERTEGWRRELAREGIELLVGEGNLLAPPEALATGAGKPYQVYTPFARAFRAQESPPRPSRAPDRIPGPARWPTTRTIDELAIRPALRGAQDWMAGLEAAWAPGESGGLARLRRFVAEAMEGYETERDRPDIEGTSFLSPHLRFGEVSIRRAWHAVGDAIAKRGGTSSGGAKFRSELLWRDFAYHVLAHFPPTDRQPLRAEFARFPWTDDRAAFRAWRQGRTGYPLVDAGMRQLWATGWMHNRVRMVVASFLVKHLLLPWQWGARWFWDTLVDADLANNSLGWQWAAGCGADAAPYFRVFNPILQGRTFDPKGTYIRRYVPELSRVPDGFVHAPWEATAAQRATWGLRLGVDYPEPIVDHATARERALAALAELKETRAP